MEEDWKGETCGLCGKKQNESSNLVDQVFKVNSSSNACGHRFCSKCIERENRRQFSCPVCKATVVKDKLTDKSLEETQVERDAMIRRRIKSIFNKTENEFGSTVDWKNYEEMVEDIIFNLVYDIDEAVTKEKVKAYEIQNQAEIRLNSYKKQELIKLENESIQNEIRDRKRREIEQQDIIRDEIQQKKELKRQNNLMMLGESNQVNRSTLIQSNTLAGINPATSNFSMNPVSSVAVFFAQRPLPQPIFSKNTTNKKIRSKEDLKRVHMVGGYDYSKYNNKNWFEIKLQLKEFSNL
eukprot:gene10067-13527_t